MRLPRPKLPKLSKNKGNYGVVDNTVNGSSRRQTDNWNLNAYGFKNSRRDAPEDNVPPGLDESGPPGLEGNGPPGLDGSRPPGLVVSTTEEAVVSLTSLTSTTYSSSQLTLTNTSPTMTTSATDGGFSTTTLSSTKTTPTAVLVPEITHSKPSESTYQFVTSHKAPTLATPNLKSSLPTVRTTPEVIVSRTPGLQTTSGIPTKVVNSKVASSIRNLSSVIDVSSTTIEDISSGAPSPTKVAGDVNNDGIETLTNSEVAGLVIEGTIGMQCNPLKLIYTNKSL